RLVLSIFALVIISLLPGLAQLQILLSVTDSTAADSQLGINQARKQAAFSGDQELTLVFQRHDHAVLNESDLCNIRRWVRKVDFSHQEIQLINSPFTARYGEETANTLTYPLAIKLNCDAPSTQSYPLSAVVDSPLVGTLVAADQKSLLIVFYLRNTLGGSKYGSFDPTVVAELEKDLAQTFTADGDLAFSLAGGAAFKLDFLRSLMRDQWVNILLLIIFCSGFRIIFGRWRGALLLGASLLVANIILFSAMGLLGVPVDMLTNSIFTIVALASIEDFVFIAQLRQANGSSTHWRQSFRNLVLPSFYTSLSTVIGFLSLCLSDIVSIQRLGLWAAIGAALEFIIVFTVVPSLLTLAPSMRHWTRDESSMLTRFIHTICRARLPRLLCISLIGLVPLAAVGIGKLEVRDSLTAVWDSDHAFNQSVEKLKDSFGWSAAIDLVLPVGEDFENAERIIAKVGKLSGVVRVESPSALIAYAGRRLSFDRTMLMYREMMLAEGTAHWYSQSHGMMRVSVFVADSELTSLSPLITDINKICAPSGCFVTGDLVAYADFADKVIKTLIESFLVSLVLVATLLLSLAKALNVPRPLSLVFASMWGPVALIGIGPWIFGGLNFITCVFAAVLVGLAGDSSIQYMFSCRLGDISGGINQRSVGSVQMTILAALGSMAFLASDFAQPRTLGLLFGAGFVALLVGDLWILKELNAWLSGRQARRQATRFMASKVQSSAAFSEPKISS
ncbi:MAG: hypothetical protein RL011_1120, partial [Pseudomonadota bacterium]